MKARLVVAAALLVLVSEGPAQATSTSTALSLAVGQEGIVYCHEGQSHVVFQSGPVFVYCEAKAPPTTTTTVPPSPVTPAGSVPGSLFNAKVTGWGVLPTSAQFVSDFVTDYKTDYGSVGVNTAPVYAVPAGTASVPLSVASGCNNFLPSTGSEAPVPSFVQLNTSSDAPMILYSTALDRVWEFWQFHKTSSGYSACWGGSAPLSSFNGVFPYPYGLSATGISYLATAITEADVASGSIDHAVAVILPRCNYSVYPADRGDCGSDAGQPSEGQWFRFSPGTAMPSGLTPFGQMVFRAILTYGMVVTDQGGAVMLEAEQSSDWAAEGNSGTDPITTSWDGQQEYQVVANLPWANLQALSVPSSVSAPIPPKPYYPWPGKSRA